MTPPRRPGIARFSLAALAALATFGTPALAGRAAKVRQEAQTLLNEGVAAINRSEPSLAVEKLRKAASIYLNSRNANYYLGVALLLDRRYAEAVEPLKVALDLDPAHLQSHVALGNAYLEMGDLEESQASFYRALKIRPEHAPALDGLARHYEAKVDDERAANLYERAIASDKGYAEAYTHYGDLLLRRGKLDEAVRLLSDAVTVRPGFAAGMNRLALAYGRLGLQNEAIATIRSAIALEPKQAAHRAALGAILLAQGDGVGAETAFREAVALDAGSIEGLRGLAEVARRRGDYVEARARIESAIADRRTGARAREELRSLAAAFEAERDRIAELDARVANGAATPEAYGERAAIEAGRGAWANAARLEAQRTAAGAPKDRLAYYLIRAGSYRQAREILDALCAEEARPDRFVNAGVASAGLGDHAAAADAYRRALALDATNARARLYLANALLRLDRRAEAIAGYKEFLALGTGGENAERVRRMLLQLDPPATGGERR